MLRIRRGWAPGIVLGLALAGCGAEEKIAEKIAEKVIEKQTGEKTEVKLSEQKLQVKTKDGDLTITAGGGGEIPPGFPSDVFVPRGATVVASVAQQPNYMLTLHAKDAVGPLSDAYASGMEQAGWTREAKLEIGPSVSLVYKKGDRTASITVAQGDQSDQGSTVTVTVARN